MHYEGQEEEIQPVLQVHTKAESSTGMSTIIKLEEFSSRYRALRVTAWVLKFVDCLKRKKKCKTFKLMICDIKGAEKAWIRDIQGNLKLEKGLDQLKGMLNVIEEGCILRCEDRLGNMNLPYEAKKPSLLPKNSLFTNLVVQEYHQRVMYGGVNATLAEVRRQFWIPKGRQVAKKMLKQCGICTRDRATPLGVPVTGQLPPERVTPSRAFDSVGVDFSGTIHLSDEKKAYIALFTCGITKGMHLGLVEDMSAPEYIGMLQRFISRRGAPKQMISDNAKTFLSASKHLKKICQKPELESYLTRNRISWKFITAKAPWQSGFYERLVGVTKTVQYKTMGKAKLRFRELETILIQVEGVLNNRPLTYQGEDLEEKVVTPNHLIYGAALPTIAEHDSDSDEEIPLNKRVRHLWKRWTKEYIFSLREFHRVNQKVIQPPRLGQLVLVVENSFRKSHWKLGKVTKQIKGRDDVVRTVKIQVMSQGKPFEIKRPLQGICPLEIDAPIKEEKKNKPKDNKDKLTVKSDRPKRIATFAGEELRKLQTDFLNQED